MKALLLHLAGFLHPGADGLRRFAHPAVGKLLVFHPRHFHVDIDAVQERPGDAGPKERDSVLSDRTGGAGAGLDRVAVIAVGTRMHSIANFLSFHFICE